MNQAGWEWAQDDERLMAEIESLEFGGQAEQALILLNKEDCDNE